MSEDSTNKKVLVEVQSPQGRPYEVNVFVANYDKYDLEAIKKIASNCNLQFVREERQTNAPMINLNFSTTISKCSDVNLFREQLAAESWIELEVRN